MINSNVGTYKAIYHVVLTRDFLILLVGSRSNRLCNSNFSMANKYLPSNYVKSKFSNFFIWKWMGDDICANPNDDPMPQKRVGQQ